MRDSQPLRITEIWKTIAFIAVILQAIPAVAAAVVAIVCWIWIGDDFAALNFFAFAVLVGGFALAWWRWLKRPYFNVLAINSAAVAVGWLLASVICSVPIASVCSSPEQPNRTTAALSHPLNARYESTSSISSSGLTVVADSTELPKAIQLWRSVNQWIGGVGLAVFAICIIKPAEHGASVYAAETQTWQTGDRVQTIAHAQRSARSEFVDLCLALVFLLAASLQSNKNGQDSAFNLISAF